MTYPTSIAAVVCAIILVGCKQEPAAPPNAGGTGTSPAPAKTEPSKPPVATTPQASGHSGEVIPLGETTLEGVGVRASRDQGEIKPGGDAPVDVWIDGGVGSAAAVRFWIGVEGAKGSVKAKAEVEAGKWHTHVEVPDPLPPDSRLWVEIEAADGKKTATSFDLKR